MSKVSSKYMRSLERYLEWENVTTPASGTFQESAMPRPPIAIREDGISAAEALCIWESRGEGSIVQPAEMPLLERYIRGKAQRDWWSKEIGWWNKNGAYMPEEFLHFIGPMPFIELFSRCPITRFVRYYYDNSYRLWEFRLDGFMAAMADRWGMGYYDRDDRDSALGNAWRQMKVKWIQPLFYRVKKA